MKEILNNLIQKSNQKIASDPAYSKKLQSVKKQYALHLIIRTLTHLKSKITT